MLESYSPQGHTVNPTRKDTGAGPRTAFAMMSPGGACWACERPLTRYPLAVLGVQAECDLFFWVCCDRCAAIVANELTTANLTVATVLDGPTAYARLFEASHRQIIAMSNDAYQCARRGGQLRVRVFPGTDNADAE
jgi:hypothetical protein